MKKCKVYSHAKNFEAEAAVIIDKKWGYCDAETGKIVIPPQWDWCDDFYEDGYAIVKGMGYYGIIDSKGFEVFLPDYYSCCNIEIKRPEKVAGVFLVRNFMTKKWGAVNLERYTFEQEIPDVSYKWDDIWWDGWGGFTVMEKTGDGRELYSIINSRDKVVVQNITEKPVRYDSPAWNSRQNSYRDGGQYFSFRIASNGDKYGLIVDGHDDTEASKLLLEPIHSYNYVIKTADKEDMEWEIAHYARLIARIPSYVTDVWENVPRDIVKDVRAYIEERNIE
jgi:hypothetical protein